MTVEIDMTNMFKDCKSLVGIDDIGGCYEFFEGGVVYAFSNTELARLKNAIPNFTFTNKDIPRLRKITNTYINQYHPEDLL